MLCLLKEDSTKSLGGDWALGVLDPKLRRFATHPDAVISYSQSMHVSIVQGQQYQALASRHGLQTFP